MRIEVETLKPVELGTLGHGDGFHLPDEPSCNLYLVLNDPDNDSGVSILCFEDYSVSSWQRDTLVIPMSINKIILRGF